MCVHIKNITPLNQANILINRCSAFLYLFKLKKEDKVTSGHIVPVPFGCFCAPFSSIYS